MQISEAARSYAGVMANFWPRPSERGSGLDEVGLGGSRRDLDSRAAGRVFAAEVLQHIDAVSLARGEHSGVAAVREHVGPAAAPRAVAHALRSAIAESEGSEGPVPRLLAAVDAGIARAESVLKRMGYDPDQVSAAAVQFREGVGGMLASEASGRASAVEGAAVSATHVRKERGSIELVTQDGDVVRIRFRSREVERVQIAGVQGEEGSALSARIASEQSAWLKIAVQGDLDAEELQAIEDFLGKVDALASEFYGGDTEGAFAAAAALGADAGEIARYSVQLALRERYDVSAAVREAPVAAQSPMPSQTDSGPAQGSQQGRVPGPTAPRTSTPTTAPASAGAAATDQSSSGSVPVGPSGASPGTTGGSEAAAGSSIGPGIDPIRNFLQHVLSATATPLNVHGVALEWRVKIELTAALLQAARPSAEPRPGAHLLADVIASAATQVEGKEGAAVTVTP